MNPKDEIKSTQDIRDLHDTKLLSIKHVIDTHTLTNKHSQTLNSKLLKELVIINQIISFFYELYYSLEET